MNLKQAMLPACYTGGGEGESGEREVADKYTKDVCKTVLEFGGGAGSVSTIVQKHLPDPTQHVVIQPNEGGFYGGLPQLRKNKAACGLKFQEVDHVLEKGEEDAILAMVHQPFDCMVVDCEDCLFHEYEKNPKLFEHVKRIQVERDDFDGRSYDKLFDILNMKLVHVGKGCEGTCNTEVWDAAPRRK